MALSVNTGGAPVMGNSYTGAVNGVSGYSGPVAYGGGAGSRLGNTPGTVPKPSLGNDATAYLQTPDAYKALNDTLTTIRRAAMSIALKNFEQVVMVTEIVAPGQRTFSNEEIIIRPGLFNRTTHLVGPRTLGVQMRTRTGIIGTYNLGIDMEFDWMQTERGRMLMREKSQQIVDALRMTVVFRTVNVCLTSPNAAQAHFNRADVSGRLAARSWYERESTFCLNKHPYGLGSNEWARMIMQVARANNFEPTFMVTAEAVRSLLEFDRRAFVLIPRAGASVTWGDKLIAVTEDRPTDFPVVQLPGTQGGIAFLGVPERVYADDLMSDQSPMEDPTRVNVAIAERYAMSAELVGYLVAGRKLSEFGIRLFDQDTNQMELITYREAHTQLLRHAYQNDSTLRDEWATWFDQKYPMGWSPLASISALNGRDYFEGLTANLAAVKKAYADNVLEPIQGVLEADATLRAVSASEQKLRSFSADRLREAIRLAKGANNGTQFVAASSEVLAAYREYIENFMTALNVPVTGKNGRKMVPPLGGHEEQLKRLKDTLQIVGAGTDAGAVIQKKIDALTAAHTKLTDLGASVLTSFDAASAADLPAASRARVSDVLEKVYKYSVNQDDSIRAEVVEGVRVLGEHHGWAKRLVLEAAESPVLSDEKIRLNDVYTGSSPPPRALLETLLEVDVLSPFIVDLVRPMITYSARAAIIGEKSNSYQSTLKKFEQEPQVANYSDGSSMVESVHVRQSFEVHVQHQDKLIVGFPYVQGYIGGNNTDFYSVGDRANRILPGRRYSSVPIKSGSILVMPLTLDEATRRASAIGWSITRDPPARFNIGNVHPDDVAPYASLAEEYYGFAPERASSSNGDTPANRAESCGYDTVAFSGYCEIMTAEGKFKPRDGQGHLGRACGAGNATRLVLGGEMITPVDTRVAHAY